MVVADIIPNEDGTNTNWVATGSPHHDEIDEDKGSPSLTDQITGNELNGDDNEVEEIGFSTLSNVDEVTQVVVWTYGNRTGTVQQPELAISWNDGSSWSGEVNVILAEGAGWTSNTFSGLSKNQTELDAFQVRYRADCADSKSGHNIGCVYVSVTYTEGAVGYGHDYMGVPSANIGSVNGVATEDILNIKGVV